MVEKRGIQISNSKREVVVGRYQKSLKKSPRHNLDAYQRKSEVFSPNSLNTAAEKSVRHSSYVPLKDLLTKNVDDRI
jgi:hypothetical protein